MRQRRTPISQGKKLMLWRLEVDAREPRAGSTFLLVALFPRLRMDFPRGVFVRHATLVEIAWQRFLANLNSDCRGLI